MYTTVINKNVSTNLDFIYNNSLSISGEAKYSINQIIPTGTTGALINFGFSTVTGKFLALASVNGNIEVRTDSISSPLNTFRLIPGQDIIIDNFVNDKDSLGSGIQSFDKIYVYNTGTSSSTLRIDSLLDPSPSL